MMLIYVRRGNRLEPMRSTHELTVFYVATNLQLYSLCIHSQETTGEVMKAKRHLGYTSGVAATATAGNVPATRGAECHRRRCQVADAAAKAETHRRKAH